VSFTEVKHSAKHALIRVGLYKPARYLNDLLLGREYRAGLKAEADFFRSLIPANSLVFDVGANIGERSEALLKAGMSVVAIEPQPACAAEAIARCGGPDFCLVHSAVGREDGNVTLYLSSVYHTMASMDPSWTEPHGSLVVPQSTLDSLVVKYGLPYYCKIDVEGYELEVLRGLTHRIPLISFEYHLSKIDQAYECIDHLDGYFNISPAEKLELLFDEWPNKTDFLRLFRAEVPERDGFEYGDIWVRAEPQSGDTLC